MAEQLKQILVDGVWRQNTGLVVLLGLCPLLAVTSTLINGLALGLATMLTLMVSNLSVSVLRGLLRPEIRIPAFVLIIASVVTAIELLMHAYFYDLFRILGIFIPLIVTNCAIIGRAEAFASRHGPLPSLMDGFATGLGVLHHAGFAGCTEGTDRSRHLVSWSRNAAGRVGRLPDTDHHS